MFAIILLVIPARMYAVEEVEEESSEQDTTGDINYEEPYVEPWEEEPYTEPYVEPWEEEPYVEPWEEEPYFEPWNENTYEEPIYYNDSPTDNYNDQPVTYEEEEPYIEEVEEPEPYVEPEIEVAPDPAELSISSVASENYNVSGIVVGDDEIIEGVLLILSNENEKIETTSAEDGTFVFSEVPNGTYSLSAEESEDYEVMPDPIEVIVDDRNKLGYEVIVTAIEVQPEPEIEEDLPIESAETEERAEETEGASISGFELSLILIASILLLITIAIVLFRKLSRR